MIFNYQSLDNKGKSRNGFIEASSQSQAKQLLRENGLYVTKIWEEKNRDSDAMKKSSSSSQSGSSIGKSSLFNRVSNRERAVFSRQLGTLLKAGMELTVALGDIAEQTENEFFKKTIWAIRENVESGAPLSRAISIYPSIFSDLYIYMLRAGESLGKIDDIMLRIADLEEKSGRIRNKIQGAMLYPAFMITMMMVVITVLMSKVVPEITKVFSRGNTVLPLPTRVIIQLSDFISNFWWLLLFAFILLIYLLYRYIHTAKGREHWDQIKMANKITKLLYLKIVTARFTRNLGLLLRSKVDLIDSLNIVKKVVQNTQVEKAIADIALEIEGGSTLSRSLKRKEIFPKMVVGMISAGEASDKLDEMLLKIADIYEEEVETSIAAFLSILEPLIIVLMAVSIGFIVLSIILPITQMNQLIK